MKYPARLIGLSFVVNAVLLLASSPIFAQLSANDREMAIGMLDMTKDAIKKNYYDPSFRGIDIDYVFEQAKERMKTAPNRDALMMTIAAAVLAFDDSHTNFFPPPRAAEIDYGWQVGMIGDDAYIIRVKPKSEAETVGLKAGDKLLAIDGFKPTRKNLWQMHYRYNDIAPSAKVKMTLLSPGADKPHLLEVPTKISKTQGVISIQQWYDARVIKKGWADTKKTHETVQFGDDLLIWKMKTFATDPINVDNIMSKAKKSKGLIIDLRDNGGGYVDTLKRLVGYFFDKDLKIGDEKRRKESKELIAKTRGSDVYKGNLIVLINHNSGSASELFARVIQLEKRGTIIGDTSAGAVMDSKFHEMSSGIGNSLWFGASVTMADLIMTDGKSLEKVGVGPDERVLPTGQDIAEGKDPVLAHAARKLGVEVAPEKAGTFFTYEWPKP